MTVLTWAAMMLANTWGICDMKKFLVILRDECGDEFSVETQALDTDAAWEIIDEGYPESFVVSFRELRTCIKEN